MNLRRNERCRVTVLVASLGLSQLCLFGCEDENGPAACSGPPVVEAFLASPSGPAVGDIIVEGTAEHDFAIRNVRVAGVEAETISGSFNFARWRATVPLSAAQALAGSDGSVVLDVEAVSAAACDAGEAEVTVEVDRLADTRLENLAVRVDYPVDGIGYLASLTGTATVTITTTSRTAGAVVRVSSTNAETLQPSGTVGGVVGSVNVVMGAAESGGSVGTTTLSSSTAGMLLIEATNGALRARTLAAVAAPPAIFPEAVVLSSATDVSVVATVAYGEFAGGSACRLVGGSGMTLEVAAESIARLVLSIGAGGATSPAMDTLECEDRYGRRASASVTLVALPTP